MEQQFSVSDYIISVCVYVCGFVCCMQDASLIFISGYKSSWLYCSAGRHAAAAGVGRRVARCSANVQGSVDAGVRRTLSPSHDTTPQPMNIYKTKLLQLRRFISSGESCGAAQEAAVSHAVLDVSGF